MEINLKKMERENDINKNNDIIEKQNTNLNI